MISDTATARVFKSGNSQAVRLPKQFRIDDSEVIIRRDGDSLILTPRKRAWKEFKNALEMFTDDFMSERKQPRKSRTIDLG
jgi:antitoxin VapB